ncbi:MAG: AI-2E family transporter [Acidobacteriaceae bacterium]|nr:AI-2E family transporter [Acidobacteriaceae bacterium]MBV9501262.1 AI-2E family transporter [Acidobacteriaceae bacterium]
MPGLDQRALRVLWTIFLFGLLLLVVYTIRETILLFAIAIFFAYMLWPVVALVEGLLQKRRERTGAKAAARQRALALGTVYVILIGGIIGIGFVIVPKIAAEATTLATTLPGMVSKQTLSTVPLPSWLEPVRQEIVNTLHREAANLGATLLPLIQQAGTKILSGVGYVLPVILIPVLAFFFLKDGPAIRSALLGSVERTQNRSTVESILDDVHDVLKNYIRALVILSIVSFCSFAIFLSVMGDPYELLLAGIVGLLEFIPVIGPLAGLVILLIVIGVTGSGGIIWILVFWGCYRVFQDYILNPYLMSSGVEIHPLLVLFGVLAGEKIGGIPGMFFSVPAIAILRVIYSRLRTNYTRWPLARVDPARKI